MAIVIGTRKVGVGKVAPRGDCGPIVCPSSLFFRQERAENGIYPIDLYSRIRMMRILVLAVHAFISRLTFLFGSIGAIMRLIARAKIGLSIVQSIVILVVIVFTISHYLAVHVNLAELTAWKKFFSNRVNSIPSCFLREPVRFHKSHIVLGIDYGVVALGKRDNFDILVERLFDSVTLHVVFTSHKEPSFLVQRSAALPYFTTSWEAA